jgi:ribosomal protein L4
LIIPAHNKDLEHAAQNLTDVKVLTAGQLNIFDLLKYDLIVLKDAFKVIEQTYLK